MVSNKNKEFLLFLAFYNFFLQKIQVQKTNKKLNLMNFVKEFLDFFRISIIHWEKSTFFQENVEFFEIFNFVALLVQELWVAQKQ